MKQRLVCSLFPQRLIKPPSRTPSRQRSFTSFTCNDPPVALVTIRVHGMTLSHPQQLLQALFGFHTICTAHLAINLGFAAHPLLARARGCPFSIHGVCSRTSTLNAIYVVLYSAFVSRFSARANTCFLPYPCSHLIVRFSASFPWLHMPSSEVSE